MPQQESILDLPGLREPAVLVGVALVSGVWFGKVMPREGECLAAVAGLAVIVLWSGGFRRRWLGGMLVLLAWFGIGAARQALHQEQRPPLDIARIVSEADQPVKLRGVVVAPWQINTAYRGVSVPTWMHLDTSTCELEVETLLGISKTWPVAGRVRLSVDGHIVGLQVGDRLEVVGRIATPSGPRNPGDFDFREYLRVQRIDRLVHCDHPEAVSRVGTRDTWLDRVALLRSQIRDACDGLFIEHLRTDVRGLADSLLLGDRSDLPRSIEDAFTGSGTMHVLAISGQHVAILLFLLWGGCRLFHLSQRATLITGLTIVLFYAWITDHRAPVTRAVLLALIMLAGRPWFRTASALNSLSVCAIAVLLWNPTELFDLGTQLSFLAVAAIILATRAIRLWEMRRSGLPDLSPERGPLGTLAVACLKLVRDAYIITAAIWLFTLPLTLDQFHIAAPVGFLINVLLTPLVTVVLGLGYLFLTIGLLVPGLAGLVATPFDFTLRLFLSIIEWGAATPWGHFRSAGPPTWWLAGHYVLLAGFVVPWRRFWRHHDSSSVPERSRDGNKLTSTPTAYHIRVLWWNLHAITSWLLLGLAVSLVEPHSTALRAEFLSVGHGGAILVEFPNGRTLVYDAGTTGDGRRAAQIIRETLFAHGHSRIDLLILSHADVDHFNGAIDLLQTVRVGQILTHRSFLELEQEGVAETCTAAANAGVAWRMLQAGDRLGVTPAAAVEVLHPPANFREEHDNSNSVVIRLEYAGRSILLTGDLEREGLNALLRQPPRPCDVLLAPHHGGKSANTPDLARWVNPRWVIASSGRPDVESRLTEIYPGALVLSTASAGRVAVEITADGQVLVERFKEREK